MEFKVRLVSSVDIFTERGEAGDEGRRPPPLPLVPLAHQDCVLPLTQWIAK